MERFCLIYENFHCTVAVMSGIRHRKLCLQGKSKATGMLHWTENQHQMALFAWAKEEIENGRLSLVALGAIPNGHKQLGGFALRNYESLGFRHGMADIYFLLPRGDYHGLFIELKTLKDSSVRQREQIQFGDILQKNGYRVEVCRGFQSAIGAINDYERAL